MARPKKCRRICGRAPYSCFKPNGVPTVELPQVELLAEELEALRLADFEGLSQQEGADQMMVSRQTFGNIVKQARFKVTSCLVEGKALMLQTETEE
ncbi:UNVERIFIED_CONTAM: hypothetical protein GTU68_054497 [Idotea baltica]|jgi:predicted DNA-binding protein (UPF0251 family)|uniref:DUF134 domain-containing protein n=1 Tax=unclassified Aliivibrio TaxID=2645654 RepID=UPI00080DE6D8|nr:MULTISPECIES: DUF134 domain-containing protein [unclassified Aliivibrio]MCL4113258.1 hypothetical protein [Idotea baltica]OCH19008.1 hypothetical protein A6E05_01265 [Aliivibrio sp. 1S165]OCH19885.1 hypothetical protein A6E03_11230 [Aliivibrio sp. 1S128]OCH30797.1 hypothetical protein A6E06_04240 [Aliivibrio sp. 1S175]